MEASRLGLPIIAICDTNCNPDPITYPIPGNDDAIRAIRLFTGAIADAVSDSRAHAVAPMVAEMTESFAEGGAAPAGDGPVVQVRRQKKVEAEEAPAAEA
jgi:small subunit ribosomal protein S2